jgi:hypothetical protein
MMGGPSIFVTVSHAAKQFPPCYKVLKKICELQHVYKTRGGGEVPLSKQNGHSRNRAARTKRMVSSSMDSWRESGSG